MNIDFGVLLNFLRDIYIEFSVVNFSLVKFVCFNSLVFDFCFQFFYLSSDREMYGEKFVCLMVSDVVWG